MGFNTTVLFLNDCLEDLKAPDFGERLHRAIIAGELSQHYPQLYIGNHKVISTHHAKYTEIIAVGGNTATVLGTTYGWHHSTPRDQIAILRSLADQHGYVLHKKPSK